MAVLRSVMVMMMVTLSTEIETRPAFTIFEIHIAMMLMLLNVEAERDNTP